MRILLPAGVILILAVLMGGCIQSPPAAPAGPAEPGTVMITDIPDTTAAVTAGRDVSLTAEKTTDSVEIRLAGGNDAASLTSLFVRIRNYDGTSVQRTIPFPETGRTYSIQYYQRANAANINVVGTFSDGFQQTLLMTSL